MKKENVIPLSALLLGAVGGWLKYLQNSRSYDEKGLIFRGDVITAVLTAFTAAFLIITLIASYKIWQSYKKNEPKTYHEAFPLTKTETFIISAAGIELAVASLMVTDGTAVLFGRSVNFTAILGVAAGIGSMLLAITACRGRKGIEQRLLSVAPAIFYAFLMTVIYKEYAGVPVLSKYCYQCLGFGLAAVSFYCTAGYSFGRTNGFVNLLSQIWAVYFLMVALPDFKSTWLMITSAGGAVISATNLRAFLREQPAQQDTDTFVNSDE